jgi:hypothetical protein
MPQITVDVPESILNYLDEHHVSVAEALEHAVVCIDLEIPNKETVRALLHPEDDYAAKDLDDAFKRVGLDKW